jgi:pyrrolysine biosynthesis protein PylC
MSEDTEMKIVIMGGKLQGVEAAYLARKAGWHVVVIDRSADIPAFGLAHTFIRDDIRTPADLEAYTADADLLLPAMENSTTLACLQKFSLRQDVPVLFDFEAYKLTSSKTESNNLFDRLGIPTPRPWPACGFPLVVKPSYGSGSRAVRVHRDARRFELPSGQWPERHVIQEFVEGPQFSIEVVGCPGAYLALQVTELEVDPSFDCKRVTAPSGLPPELEAAFQAVAVRIADALHLKGLMDVEAVLHEGKFKILEIDARFPSQTPTAVWESSGVNMLEMLADFFLSPPAVQKSTARRHQGVIYEHIRVSRGKLEVVGEHAMSQAGALQVQTDFFGADEALTDFHIQKETWVATLICTETTRRDAWQKRNQVVADICRHFEIRDTSDSTGV